jgi:hypothetical protein
LVVGACNSLSGIDGLVVQPESADTHGQSDAGGDALPGDGSDDTGPRTEGTVDADHDATTSGDADADTDAASQGGDGSADGPVDCGTLTCATPLCCDGGCASMHSNGLGQYFYDCAPLKTFNVMQAFAACTAFTGKMSLCTNDPITCGGGDQVCSSGASMCACWRYNGSNPGHVLNSGATCQCLGSVSPTWN